MKKKQAKKLQTDLIRIKLAEIEESLGVVGENIPEEFKEFEKLGLVKDGIYKRVEFCIENVLDICSIILSDLTLGIPEDEEDIVDKLIKSKIFSDELGGRIKKMKGFRNFLVHRYGRIDDETAYKSINNGFSDFEEFITETKKFLKTR